MPGWDADQLKRLQDMKDENRQVVDLLESLKPVRFADIADRDRQLATAHKLRDLLIKLESL